MPLTRLEMLRRLLSPSPTAGWTMDPLPAPVLVTSSPSVSSTREVFMVRTGLTIAPSGTWTQSQLRAILGIIGPQADAAGLELTTIDVSTQDMAVPKFLIAVRCKRHQKIIAPDSLCEECLREDPAP